MGKSKGKSCSTKPIAYNEMKGLVNEDEAFFRQLEETSHSQALVLVGDLKPN